MGNDCLLQSNENILHLLSSHGVSTCICLTESSDIVIVLALDGRTSEQQGVVELFREVFWEDEFFCFRLLVSETLYQFGRVSIGRDHYKLLPSVTDLAESSSMRYEISLVKATGHVSDNTANQVARHGPRNRP